MSRDDMAPWKASLSRFPGLRHPLDNGDDNIGDINKAAAAVRQ